MPARASRINSKTLTGGIARLAADQRGVVSMIFAIALTGVLMMMACAIDVARANWAHTKLAAAADAATLFVAKELKLNNTPVATLQTMARDFFNADMGNALGRVNVTNFIVKLTPDGQGITIDVTADIPTTFARVVGIQKMNLPTTATAVFGSLDIEVGMQLDVTGSMNDTINGVPKIDSLKASTKNLLDILLPAGGTGTTKVRVGIAPFSAGVNAGGYANTVAGGSAPGNCVYERRTPSADGTDDIPTGSETLLTRNDLSGANPCPAGAVVMPLTTDKASLLTAVNGFSAGGSTAGHLGASWSWYLLSPNWSSIWPSASTPAAYNDKKTVKYAIMETDGIYNTVNGYDNGDYGSTAADSQARAKAVCKAMRDDGIIIYAVGFIKVGDDPNAANTLIDCAGTTGKFIKVQDGAELDAAFQSIAKDISNLRISH